MRALFVDANPSLAAVTERLLRPGDPEVVIQRDPDTAPSALPAYPAGQLSRECECVYDITSLMAAVQQGYGIGVYEPCAAYSGSYSPHYTMFYGLGSDFVPVLTVTYS